MPVRPRYVVGVDVGSTTLKAVVAEAEIGAVVWKDYRRHQTRQPEMLLEFLRRIEAEIGIAPSNARVFITGSGGSALAPFIGAAFVQEVVAVSLAVEARYPDTRSVIELGGQDAKIIVFAAGAGGERKKIASMNDKCAGGTGAVIDKITARLKIPSEDLAAQRYSGVRIHPVAGKCGVFAETDINSLQKQGVPADELMASLFDAIVLQNLTVLARGNTLSPRVLLLGGPNTFVRGMREAWRLHLQRLWVERRVHVPDDVPIEDLISVPDHAQYFAALGAADAGRADDQDAGWYRGTAALDRYIRIDRGDEKARSGTEGLSRSGVDLRQFVATYGSGRHGGGVRGGHVDPPLQPVDRADPRVRADAGAGPPAPAVVGAHPCVRPDAGADRCVRPVGPSTPHADVLRAFLGIDGGSTSTKAVLVTESGDVLAKAYQLSNGNPIQDTIDLLSRLDDDAAANGVRFDVLGAGTTGYAKNILRDVFGADVALVETVAHAKAALNYYDDPHVIVDVGGQDIKLIVLRDGRVKDFRLNTQCSAGNGYFLQATAEALRIPLDQYATRAFEAARMPVFGYGCAVFLQADIVNAQRQGWGPDEILAGLAAVLPKNIFYYVAAVSSPARLGRRFVLQGGTQHNLAVVKAEVDFVTRAFDGTGIEPEIFVPEHCAESGAIGAALEAARLWREGRATSFIGFAAARTITYRTTCTEATRCRFCRNACQRTFVDVNIEEPSGPDSRAMAVPVGTPRATHESRRFIIATCERGAAEDILRVRNVKSELDAIKAENPNLVEIAAREVWKPCRPAIVADPVPVRAWSRAARVRVERMRRRSELRVGIPRALNLYTYAPLFSAYLESLGVNARNIVYSDYTTDALYRSGSARGAIDPCFPSKVALAHVHNLLRVKHPRRKLDCIFFPMIDVLDSPLVNVPGSNACPAGALTPEVVKAAFTKETDAFAESGVRYLDPILDLADRRMLARQLFECWAPILGVSQDENARAVEAGYVAFTACWSRIRERARAVLDRLEQEDRLGIVVLGRPYHHDPGINHGILDELQKLGYSILSQSTLPLDAELLDRLFGDEQRAGAISHPLEISDVWKNASVASTNQKLWAAKLTARHPNLVALELSSFKCGHDAPVYSVIEQIVESSGTPFFAFKDIDENRSLGSIRIRIETIDYFLRRYRERMAGLRRARVEVNRELDELEQRLRAWPLHLHASESGDGLSPA